MTVEREIQVEVKETSVPELTAIEAYEVTTVKLTPEEEKLLATLSEKLEGEWMPLGYIGQSDVDRTALAANVLHALRRRLDDAIIRAHTWELDVLLPGKEPEPYVFGFRYGQFQVISPS